MARHGQTVAAFEYGISGDTLKRGSFTTNTWRDGDTLAIRPGFGQTSQYDTTISQGNVTPLAFLGACPIHTIFGHDQIVTITSASYYTGDLADKSGEYVNGYLARVYDTTTDEWHEEPLVGHSGDVLYDDWASCRGAWQSVPGTIMGAVRSYARWVRSDGDESACWFAPYRGSLLFGNPTMGTWVYRPASFTVAHRRQIHDADSNASYRQGRFDSILIHRVSASTGYGSQDGLGYSYLARSEWPVVVTATAWRDRMVYASNDGYIWFSDEGNPSAIANLNFAKVPTDSGIKALSVVADKIMVLTTRGIFAYLPSEGDFLASGGRFVALSETIGCSSPSAAAVTDIGLVWVDQNGCYASADGLSATPIDTGIRAFWTDSLSHPWIHYSASAGFANPIVQQPPATYRHEDDPLLHVAYDFKRGILHVVYPGQRISLARDVGAERWTLWRYATSSDSALGVEDHQPFENPWLVWTDELHMVSTETVTADDTSIDPTTGVAVNGDATTQSVVISRLGLGGGRDRTVGYPREDRRVFRGKYREAFVGGGNYCVWMDHWIPIPQGYVLPNGTTTADANWYWLPLWYSHGHNTQPTDLDIDFRFDSTNWALAQYAGTQNIAVVFPTERFNLSADWKVYTWDGAIPAAGDRIRVHFHGATTINTTQGNRDPMVLIPFHHTGLGDVTSMGIRAISGSVTTSELPQTSIYIRVWETCDSKVARHPYTDVSQGVEWCYLTPIIAASKDDRVRGRGMYITLSSSGQASGRPATYHGLMNIASSNDNRIWNLQIVDVGLGVEEDDDIDTTQKRVRSPAPALAMSEKIFNGVLIWGSTGVPGSGNYLIDDEQTDKIAYSARVKGDSIQWLLFGSTQHPAEHLKISGVDAVVQQRGLTRRGRR